MEHLFVVFVIASATISPACGFLENTVEPASPLELLVLQIQSEIHSLQQTVNSLTSLNTSVHQLTSSVSHLNGQLNTLNRTLHHPVTVAFTAQVSHDLVHLGQAQHLIFDRILTNVGHAYDEKTGHFTAPVAGTYIFFLTITNLGQYDSTFRLVRNGSRLFTSLASGDAQNSHTVTHVVTLGLRAGDQVWAQNEGSVSINEGVSGGLSSSFSGHLITTEF